MINDIPDLKLQFTRGAMQLDLLNAYAVPVLEFPFYDVLDLLYLLRIRLDQEKNNGEPANKPKNPPISALNDFLQFLVPGLGHPFIQNYDEAGKQLPRSRRWLSPMPALGIPYLEEEGRGDPIPPSLLRQVVKFWLDVVVSGTNAYFKEEERQKQFILDGIIQAKNAVDNAQFEWQHVNLGSLWAQRREHAIGYRALRSLLSSQFILTSKLNPIPIVGIDPEWRAAQEGNGLIPVSKGIQHEDGSYYAYALHINLRDMPGRAEPLVYFMPRLRRYLSSKLKWKGDDDIRVMIEYPSPLNQDLKQTALFRVQTPIRITYDQGNYVYRNYIVAMLQKLVGNSESDRALVSVDTLLTSPEIFVNPHPDWNNATYHIIYNTGMKPDPLIDAGLPMTHVKTIHYTAATNLEAWIQVEAPLPVVEGITISDTQIQENEWLSLISIKQMRDAFKIWTGRQPVKKRALWPQRIQDRFKLALNTNPLVVLLFADTDNALQSMEFEVRGVLGVLTLEESLPDGFEIYPIKTPNEFILQLTNLKGTAWRDDVKEIQKRLTTLESTDGRQISIETNKSYIAVIQRPKEPSKDEHKKIQSDGQKKSALRAAFGSSRIRSQMIRPFPDSDATGLQVRSNNPKQAERSRLLNAISDALISGTGMTYAPPFEHYVQLLGFQEEFAREIVVEYWVRYKVQKPKTDFIAMVRQYANGYIEVIFPDSKDGLPQKPKSVHEASLYLQTLFAKGRKEDRIYTMYENTDVPDERVLKFFESQLTPRDVSTLIVPQVGDWRSRQTDWFNDNLFTFNTISIGNRSCTVDKLSNVRIVKMLTDEQHNMRYWADGETHQKANLKTLLAVKDTLAEMPVIYSIDSREEDDETEPKIDDIIQRGRVIEFAAQMMQEVDDIDQQYAWCSIPHLARIHPGWSRAKTIYPYPYHIVCNIVDDALWAVYEEKR